LWFKNVLYCLDICLARLVREFTERLLRCLRASLIFWIDAIYELRCRIIFGRIQNFRSVAAKLVSKYLSRIFPDLCSLALVNYDLYRVPGCGIGIVGGKDLMAFIVCGRDSRVSTLDMSLAPKHNRSWRGFCQISAPQMSCPHGDRELAFVRSL